jgi:hypothetical protein
VPNKGKRRDGLDEETALKVPGVFKTESWFSQEPFDSIDHPYIRRRSDMPKKTHFAQK